MVGSGDNDGLSGRGLNGFSPQGMGNLAWSIARQAQMVQDTYRRCEESTISHATGRLAVYTVSFLDIGESLLKKLFAQIAEANVHKHGKFLYFDAL